MAVALSGGVDSNSVLASLLEAGHRPYVLSYTPSTHESTDYLMARSNAEAMGLKFFPVVVDMSAPALEAGVRALVKRGYTTKLEVESLSPMLSILTMAADCRAEVLFTGDQADGFFINNNWMSRNFDRARGIPGPQRQHVKEDADTWRIDELRDIYWREDRSCSEAVVSLGDEAGVRVVVPYRSERLLKAFRGTHWREVNEPRLKEPIRLAYREWFDERLTVRPKPVNLHRGDSRFAETIGRTLMAEPHLAGPWRTPTGLYAAMGRGEV